MGCGPSVGPYIGRPLTVNPRVPKTFLILVTDFAFTGFNGTDQFHSCAASALGVFCSKGKLIIPFEITFNSVLLHETEIEGFA